MNPADAIRSLAKIPEQLLGSLGGIPYPLLQALAAWLDGGEDSQDSAEALERLPSVLRSELALARMQERAAKG